MSTLAKIETVMVAIAAAFVLAWLTEPVWKPVLVAWLMTHPLMVIDCGMLPK